jgi:EAL domain-containing protein (putative c-di-GMP-specific phosphodiesterase class I)
MAHNLGLGVVAEGVETLEQASLLSLQGCDRLQGSGIADPMPLEALLQWQPEIPPLARAAATSH